MRLEEGGKTRGGQACETLQRACGPCQTKYSGFTLQFKRCHYIIITDVTVLPRVPLWRGLCPPSVTSPEAAVLVFLCLVPHRCL